MGKKQETPDLLFSATIEGLPPTVNHLWRAGKRRLYKTKEAANWQRVAIMQMRQGRCFTQGKNGKQSPYEEKVRVTMRLYIKGRRRMDIDNRIKALQDCLAPAGVIKDDSQVWKLEVERIQAPQESVLVEVWTI